MSVTMEKANKSKGKRKPARKNPIIPEMVGIGSRIKQARELKKFTQSDLAEKIGTNEQDIGQVENGWRSMSVPRVHLFAKALGVSPEWVFSGINPKVHAALVLGAKKFAKAVEAHVEGSADSPS